MLGANALPNTDVHEHDSLNINPAKQCWMRCKCVALPSLRNNAALMQLRHLKGKKMLLLPSLRIDERGELLRRGSD